MARRRERVTLDKDVWLACKRIELEEIAEGGESDFNGIVNDLLRRTLGLVVEDATEPDEQPEPEPEPKPRRRRRRRVADGDDD